MNLHLTLNGRRVDGVPINPRLRHDSDYIEDMKRALLQKCLDLNGGGKACWEFYTDPSHDLTPALETKA